MKKYARILKDGSYNNYDYKKGDVYEIDKIDNSCFYLDIKGHRKIVMVTCVDTLQYGLEAELVTENKIIEIWD
jgi:hypothetical protein